MSHRIIYNCTIVNHTHDLVCITPTANQPHVRSHSRAAGDGIEKHEAAHAYSSSTVSLQQCRAWPQPPNAILVNFVMGQVTIDRSKRDITLVLPTMHTVLFSARGNLYEYVNVNLCVRACKTK